MNKWTYKINIKHVIKLDVIMQYQIRFYNPGNPTKITTNPNIT